jgi:hypothetical protein
VQELKAASHNRFARDRRLGRQGSAWSRYLHHNRLLGHGATVAAHRLAGQSMEACAQAAYAVSLPMLSLAADATADSLRVSLVRVFT